MARSNEFSFSEQMNLLEIPTFPYILSDFHSGNILEILEFVNFFLGKKKPISEFIKATENYLFKSSNIFMTDMSLILSASISISNFS